MLLPDLPAEVIYLVATHLSTASALAFLGRTCRRLHEIISGEDWRIFRAFLNSRFYNIPTPPFWKDAAQALTSRSRALDRHAIVGRFVRRPSDAEQLGGSLQATRNDNPTHGYRPAIDSYEVWNGSSWHERREVLAWSAGHELILQIRQTGSQPSRKSFVFNDLEHISSHDDINSIHLLRPDHGTKGPDQEHLILGRMRGELVHLAIAPESHSYELKQKFQTYGLEIERTDISNGPEPILATQFSNGTIVFYSTATNDAEVQAFGNFQIGEGGYGRNRSSKFLSPNRFAVATARPEDPIAVSTVSQERISTERSISADDLVPAALNRLARRPIVTALEPLSGQTGDSPGNTFLAAWGDGALRLHDLRSHKPYEMLYVDIADYNPVYSIHPFGHDRFVVGAGGDAVLKIFDLRMPNTYSYRETTRQATPKANGFQSSSLTQSQPSPTYPSKDLSIFLSVNPAPSRNGNNVPRFSRNRYRGPIYTMSSPSLLSPTIYTGIAGGMVRLDFASTDDLTGPNQTWYRDALDLNLDYNKNKTTNANDIIELSAYERPDSRDTTTCSKLRSQKPFSEIDDQNIANEQATGWDRRWRPLEAPGAWRRRDF